MRTKILDHMNFHSYCEKVNLSVETFAKKACSLAEKLVTATVVMVIAGLLIFGFFLGLLQFAFIIFC